VRSASLERVRGIAVFDADTLRHSGDFPAYARNIFTAEVAEERRGNNKFPGVSVVSGFCRLYYRVQAKEQGAWQYRRIVTELILII
jgi:hypothetical protein